MSLNAVASWAKLRAFARRFRAELASVVIYALAVGALTLALPVAAQVLINNIAFSTLMQPLVVLGALLAVALALSAVFQGLQTWVAELLSRKLFATVAGDAAHGLANLASASAEALSARSRVNRFFEVVALEKSLASLLFDGIAAVLQIVVGLVLLSVYHPLLLAFDLLLLASIFFIVRVLGRGALRTAIEESSAKYAVAALLEGLAEAPAAIGTAAARQHVYGQVRRGLDAWLVARRAHFRVALRQMMGFWTLQVVASVTLLTGGGWLVMNGELALGQLVAAELVLASTVGSLAKLGKQLPKLYDFVTSLIKLPQLTELPVELGQAEVPVTGPAALEVVDQALTGAVPGAPPLRLYLPAGSRRDVRAEAARRRRLFDLMAARDRGAETVVKLGGVNLRELDPGAVRDRVRFARDPELIPGSVYDNVRVGRDDVSLEQARAALEAVGLTRVVDVLADGGHTDMRQARLQLGTVERTLLTLARAIAGRPSVVLLDGLLDGLPRDALAVATRALGQLAADCSLVVGTGESAVSEDLMRMVPDFCSLGAFETGVSLDPPQALSAGGQP